jgi:hydroxyacylglutathione hydrolase
LLQGFKRTLNTTNDLPAITSQEFKRDPHKFDLIIDVREQSEVDQGMIPNAHHYPLNSLLQDLQQLEIDPKSVKPESDKHSSLLFQFPNKKLLIYCLAGIRSAKAANALNRLGFDATNLTGGYRDYGNK